MKKLKILQKITDIPLVAVVRANSPEKAIRISEACLEGGIRNIEITFTTPRAEEAITHLNQKHPNMVVGAGTVLDPITARIAIMAGAQFIVSPSFNEDIIKLCHLYQIPYMPGCETITEMVSAMSLGADVIKLFPGSAFGPDYVKAIKGPLPDINLMPTGGVDITNVDQWLNNGCVAVGIGGNLIAPAKDDNYSEITKLAKEYIEKIKQVTNNNILLEELR
ncbi:bifunctional 2-keto-4-hydroxyglutarate aldolase/2-keto-3-deoxy-6-phosphogluconate aldolase [Peribacillus psychrosaccharolyticus]|uniref:Bifunctional 2-keto-4-hydroxyglutarate aldolase/2-keto-3-deoxy-6-phosphogluconate aldolase n=1 Tax=Peribacillus psychrosaccharolyticus TaxID=1407 RepID=A0A974S1U6_PERPY|nr:bifunctional 2-keto-4-hydroxyglutarate aldolase/2-keto-3-deoxy-6-phosphogluconate aldolase [Peribacillus psychrosaccharolyticus]MEC2057820.1 bifunctional 2-keto-4-hydroxyglutarate aldolase/2-keto-3-deoxy-6-phosphogluconate aldolase [Peribacillus psychrosaccharolyticus]MED3746346.1 bifunctional 2-keto-4-hydroxyglutarate aldolase/2-keto-3-deoxy-6-phosphogluconate aldolase [Peribacillus psychrosaccharolyticus]QQT01858.1 bifunctional 2-keto-4-hydroxyglutarate aldolase/2-keto-3-deoxy-6-phosphogluc